MDDQISAEAVALLAERRWPHSARAWERLDDETRGQYLDEARADLAVAAPLLRAQGAAAALELADEAIGLLFMVSAQELTVDEREEFLVEADQLRFRARQLREGGQG